MEIRNEVVGFKGILDQLPEPVCCGDLRINSCHECLLEIYGDEKMILILILFRITICKSSSDRNFSSINYQ